MASGTVNFAGSTISGAYDSNQTLRFSITLPSGIVLEPGPVLTGSFIRRTIATLSPEDASSLQSIFASYAQISSNIADQIQTQETTGAPAPPPPPPEPPPSRNPPEEPPINGLDPPPPPEPPPTSTPPEEPPINGLDLPPPEEPINGLDLPPQEEPINGLDLPPPEEPINGLDLPPEPADEFGDLDAAIERQQASEPVLSEDGEVALGVRRNTETGEIYYTDPPPPDPQEYPDEFGDLDQAIRDQQTPDEFGDLDAAIADQEGTGLREPPMLSDDEVDAYLNNAGEGDNEQVEFFGDEEDEEDDDGNRGLQGDIDETQRQATAQDTYNYAALKDWRVAIALAPGARYLYQSKDPGILKPLQDTDGVIFPYTPQISVQYSANYDAPDIPHSNYKIFQYKNSSVDSVTITGDFTAQDTYEANYVLAVIHFFRSVTKMFYGQDQYPTNGTPPPLCYVYGLGEYQFNKHPVAITGFTYNLPNDVDYIRASVDLGATLKDAVSSFTAQDTRRLKGVAPGGNPPPPVWTGDRETNSGGTVQPTYVPTKMQITINAVPIVSRLDISDRFSLTAYGTGDLLQGIKNPRGGGIW